MIISKGLRFTSRNFSAECEVWEVREKENKVDLLMKPSDRHDWISKDWSLSGLKEGFENNSYEVLKPEIRLGL